MLMRSLRRSSGAHAALCLLSCLLLLVGCGSGREFEFVEVDDTTVISGPNLSGQVGAVSFQTELEAPQTVTGQTAVLLESPTVPIPVTHFRFVGLNSEGTPVYGPLLVPKASSVLLEEVPVEVVALRVELMVETLVLGGVRLPIQVQSGQTTTVTNPTYAFAGFDAGEPGQPGPPGPPGEPVEGPTAYGSFTFTSNDGSEQPVDHGEILDFPQTVTSVGGVVRAAVGDFQVEQDGDYLLDYRLVFLNFDLRRQTEDFFENRVLLLLNGEPIDVNELADPDFQDTTSLGRQTVLSLQGGDRLQLRFCASSCGCGPFALLQGDLSLIRVGDRSGDQPQPLEDSCPEPDWEV